MSSAAAFTPPLAPTLFVHYFLLPPNPSFPQAKLEHHMDAEKNFADPISRHKAFKIICFLIIDDFLFMYLRVSHVCYSLSPHSNLLGTKFAKTFSGNNVQNSLLINVRHTNGCGGCISCNSSKVKNTQRVRLGGEGSWEGLYGWSECNCSRHHGASGDLSISRRKGWWKRRRNYDCLFI